MAKSSGGQRESEGVVVPSIAAKHNAAGGKGPHFGHAGRGGTREGMAGVTPRPNHPAGAGSGDNVRRLQGRLSASAKRSPARRFHALYDRIHRGDVLWAAWQRVRANRGAAGVDGLTLAAAEAYGVERMLAELQERLRQGRYRVNAGRKLSRNGRWFKTVNATSMMLTSKRTRRSGGWASKISGGARAVLDGSGVGGDAAGSRRRGWGLQDGGALLAEGSGRGPAASAGPTPGAAAVARR